jgi:thioredoxin 2
MNATHLDDKGVIEICPECGQKNRVSFSHLGDTARCGKCKRELPRLDAPIEIDEEVYFESLIGSSNLPVLVDFWADWCGPCKTMAPEVKRVAGSNAERFVVAKVNTEGLPTLAQRLKINAIPTLVVFSRGVELARSEGALPSIEIERFVEKSVPRQSSAH